MKMINNIDELLSFPGKKIAFIGGTFNPPHFGHLEFIKKAVSIKNLDQVVICPQSHSDEIGLEELHHRMRMMDLMLEINASSNIHVMSPNVCDGIQSKIFIDDIFYLLKRQKKEVFILIGCNSLKQCAEFFKSLDVTFIIGCNVARADVEKELISKQMKCIFIDDIIPCSSQQTIEDVLKQDIYLSTEVQEYIKTNALYGYNKDCENCN